MERTGGGGGVRDGREGPKREVGREGPREREETAGGATEEVEGEGGEERERRSTGMRRFCCFARAVRCSAWN